MRAARFGLVAPFLVILAACDTAPSTAPTLAVASSVPAAGVQSLRGQWEGTATFQSLSGVPPSCTPLMWRPGASDATSADIIWGTAGVLMTLHQRATEDCRFLLTESSGRITGAAWPDDPFDCLLVPSFCSDRCLIRTTSSTWNCEGTPPELWVADLALNAEVSSARDRMDGTVAITYCARKPLKTVSSSCRNRPAAPSAIPGPTPTISTAFSIPCAAQPVATSARSHPNGIATTRRRRSGSSTCS